MGNKSWILRDINKRVAAVKVEATRNAYLAVARNTTLPAQTRHKAQLALNSYNDGVGRMVSLKNRCMWTGRGYGEYLRRRQWPQLHGVAGQDTSPAVQRSSTATIARGGKRRQQLG